MSLTISRMRGVDRRVRITSRAWILVCLAIACKANALAQVPNQIGLARPEPSASPTASSPSPKISMEEADRVELIKLITSLQERVEKLEAAQASGASIPAVNSAESVVPAETSTRSSETPNANPPDSAPVTPQDDGNKFDGRYTPNLGFKVVNTEYGDMNISIYTYVRYLNQLGLDSTYTDAFRNIKNIQERQDVQLQKLQIKFLGWIINPKLRYFLYAWTSNANQGLGAQVVLAGNLQYTVNKYFTFGGGIRSLPGTRSVEGNFPFWLNVDSRHIADEFMRPSYTSGFWATGEINKRLKYQVMLGNNISTLGVPASRLDNGLNTISSALIWFPTGDFEKGFSGQGWGDFEHHDKLSTRLAFHFSHSNENKESQPDSEQFENTQLRLSDGTVIFTPDIFGPGVTITDARYRMATVDGALKYRGFALEGEYFWRWLDNFKFTEAVSPEILQQVPTRLFDHAFQIQGSAMVIPKSVQAYMGFSKVFGQFGQPRDFRFGVNYFPFKNKVVRWNTEALYLHDSPVGYTSVPYPVGGQGWIFHSSWELAF
ncbi:MAG TPA: hypothetical protein VJU84_18590 [Pyrinomonadaceae bacterium]|nr:hypothetical protein [Pyrinomonadaceae bacterium]